MKQITTEEELRSAFWEYIREIKPDTKSMGVNAYNILFGEYIDGLCKDGIISMELYNNASLVD